MSNIKKMTIYELQEEINACEQHKEHFGVGIKDIVYLDTLYLEVYRRGYTTSANFKLVDDTEYKPLKNKGDE